MKRMVRSAGVIRTFGIFFHKNICLILLIVLSGCASFSAIDDSSGSNLSTVLALKGDPVKEKSIFVFLDGTQNTANSRTNVWRLFEFLRQKNDQQMTAIYLKGVGTIDDAPLTGSALGRGMERRILESYSFISNNYNPSDKIYIFGFSRGAHQARSLAGLISYAGIPVTSNEKNYHRMVSENKIIELLKKKDDQEYLEDWISWRPGQQPILAEEIKSKYGIEMQPAEVAFLGIWDTVPGSSLKEYGLCKENKGFVKKYLYWLIPGVDKGERYKTETYPPIHQIAHAVALDEKRSKFSPILLCKEINPRYSKNIEVWFPGAHADVGGGYQDSEELPSISLEWMMEKLKGSYEFDDDLQINKNPKGLAHWSIKDSPANIGSKCLDRNPPEDAVYHISFKERKSASPVPVRWKGTIKYLDYPIYCSTPEPAEN